MMLLNRPISQVLSSRFRLPPTFEETIIYLRGTTTAFDRYASAIARLTIASYGNRKIERRE